MTIEFCDRKSWIPHSLVDDLKSEPIFNSHLTENQKIFTQLPPIVTTHWGVPAEPLHTIPQRNHWQAFVNKASIRMSFRTGYLKLRDICGFNAHCLLSEMPVSNRGVNKEGLAHSLSPSCECILAAKLLRSTHSATIKFKPFGRFCSKLLGLCSGINTYKFHLVLRTSVNECGIWNLRPLRARCSSTRHGCKSRNMNGIFTLLSSKLV
jgi:hypothetical protein